MEDLLKGSVEVLFHGEARDGRSRRSGSSGGGGGRSFIRYDKYYDDDRRDRRRAARNRSQHNFDDIILETRGEANEVLNHLVDLVADYGSARVADLYDAVGIETTYTDGRFGWENLSRGRGRKG